MDKIMKNKRSLELVTSCFSGYRKFGKIPLIECITWPSLIM